MAFSDRVHRPSEFGAVRDLRNMGIFHPLMGAHSFNPFPSYYAPKNPLALMINPGNYVETQISRVPHEMRTNK